MDLVEHLPGMLCALSLNPAPNPYLHTCSYVCSHTHLDMHQTNLNARQEKSPVRAMWVTVEGTDIVSFPFFSLVTGEVIVGMLESAHALSPC